MNERTSSFREERYAHCSRTVSHSISMIFHTISDKFAYLFLSHVSCTFIVAVGTGFHKTCRPAYLKTHHPSDWRGKAKQRGNVVAACIPTQRKPFSEPSTPLFAALSLIPRPGSKPSISVLKTISTKFPGPGRSTILSWCIGWNNRTSWARTGARLSADADWVMMPRL